MLRKAVAGLAGLGLVGGAAGVHYDDSGNATVSVTSPTSGHVETVRIKSGNGQTFSCPQAVGPDLDAKIEMMGRIKITLRHVRATERTLVRRYPKRVAPNYDTAVREHNAILSESCVRE